MLNIRFICDISLKHMMESLDFTFLRENCVAAQHDG